MKSGRRRHGTVAAVGSDNGPSRRREAMGEKRRFRTLAHMGWRREVRRIADLRADEQIVGEVQTHALQQTQVRGERPGLRHASRADPCQRLSRTPLGLSGAEWINLCRGNAMNSKGGGTGFTLEEATAVLVCV